MVCEPPLAHLQALTISIDDQSPLQARIQRRRLNQYGDHQLIQRRQPPTEDLGPYKREPQSGYAIDAHQSYMMQSEQPPRRPHQENKYFILRAPKYTAQRLQAAPRQQDPRQQWYTAPRPQEYTAPRPQEYTALRPQEYTARRPQEDRYSRQGEHVSATASSMQIPQRGPVQALAIQPALIQIPVGGLSRAEKRRFGAILRDLGLSMIREADNEEDVYV